MSQPFIKLGLLLCFALSFNTQAEMFQNNYVSVSPLYSEVTDFESNSEAGVAFSFGTEIHRQWYAEVGYNLFSSGFDGLDLFTASEPTLPLYSGTDASAFYLAFLGKAEGKSGELYYRVGLAALNVQSQQLGQLGTECEVGDITNVTLNSGTNYSLCDLDETQLAGVIGLGFDTFIGYQTQIRLSVDHFRSTDDIKVSSIQLGFRYNF